MYTPLTWQTLDVVYADGVELLHQRLRQLDATSTGVKMTTATRSPLASALSTADDLVSALGDLEVEVNSVDITRWGSLSFQIDGHGWTADALGHLLTSVGADSVQTEVTPQLVYARGRFDGADVQLYAGT